MSERGRFAVVTNLRGFGPPEPGRPSRGILLTDLLAGEGRYAEPTDSDLSDFNPLNLIVLRQGEIAFWGNRPAPVRQALTPGVYGLSNGALDEPWPKTVRLKAILQGWLGVAAAQPEDLFAGLREDILPKIAAPATAPSEIPQEPPQSPIFIRHPVYGTRCSTVVAIDRDGRGVIIERRFDSEGVAVGDTALSFTWPW